MTWTPGEKDMRAAWANFHRLNRWDWRNGALNIYIPSPLRAHEALNEILCADEAAVKAETIPVMTVKEEFGWQDGREARRFVGDFNGLKVVLATVFTGVKTGA